MARHHHTLTHRHRIPEQKVKPLPLLCELPRDTEVVQITALGAAMDTAVRCASGGCNCRYSSHLTPVDSLYTLAQALANLYRHTVVDGKRGTNDVPAFNAIFHEIVPSAYVGFLAFLQRTPDVVKRLASLDRVQRMTTLCASAQAQLALLTTCPDGSLPLTWSPEESEVG